MPFILKGDFGTATFSGSVNENGELSNRVISLNTEAALNFFKRYVVLMPDVLANFLGRYSLLNAGRQDKVRMASLVGNNHVLQSRKNGCVWNPKGKYAMSLQEITLEAIEYNGEQCPDVFYNGCLEKIYGEGNAVRDIMGTPEGKAIFGELLNVIYEDIGNSFYELVEFGQHPLIDQADTGGWYQAAVDQDKWNDFKDQQEALGGHITLLDYLKNTTGLDQMNIDIPGASATAYTGNALDLVQSLIDNSTVRFKAYMKRGVRGTGFPVIELSPDLWNDFESRIIQSYTTIPDMMYYYFTSEVSKLVGISSEVPIRGVLMYKGHLVVRKDEWDAFDAMTGTKTYRAVLYAPGNFALPYSIPGVRSAYDGLGFRLTQRLEPPYQGMTYMDTTFKVGTGILDNDFVTMASKTFVPV